MSQASRLVFHGADSLGSMLAAELLQIPGALVLLNAGPHGDADAAMAQAKEFAAIVTAGDDALVVTLLRQPPAGLDHFAGHATAASLWAFTREAALEWAPRRIRVNAIAVDTVPDAVGSQPAQPAFRMQAASATEADIARVVVAMVRMKSMTGQLVRLGG